MKIHTYFFTVFALLICLSCHKENSDDTFYMASCRVQDQQIPYPYILQQNKDSLFLYNFLGEKIGANARKIDSSKKLDTLKFNEKNFLLFNIKPTSFEVIDLNDTINFKRYKNGNPVRKHAAQFIKTNPFSKTNIAEIKEKIKQEIWSYTLQNKESKTPNEDLEIKKAYLFKQDSVLIYTTYHYQEKLITSSYETKQYHIFEIDKTVFLSFGKGDDNPQPMYGIKNVEDKQISLIDVSTDTIQEKSFTKSSLTKPEFATIITKTNAYSNCFDAYQGEYYFGSDVTLKEMNLS